jgi:hypothetical protein
VGTERGVAVGEGGNQTIVCVGVGVIEGTGVSVTNEEPAGRQAARRSNPTRKERARNRLIKRIMTIFVKNFLQAVVKLPCKHSF